MRTRMENQRAGAEGLGIREEESGKHCRPSIGGGMPSDIEIEEGRYYEALTEPWGRDLQLVPVAVILEMDDMTLALHVAGSRSPFAKDT